MYSIPLLSGTTVLLLQQSYQGKFLNRVIFISDVEKNTCFLFMTAVNFNPLFCQNASITFCEQ